MSGYECLDIIGSLIMYLTKQIHGIILMEAFRFKKWSNESDSLTAGVTGKKITLRSPSWTTRVYKDIVSYDPTNVLTNYEDEPKVGNNLFGNTNWAYDQNDNDEITHNVKDHNGTGNVILNYNRRWRQEPNSEKGEDGK